LRVPPSAGGGITMSVDGDSRGRRCGTLTVGSCADTLTQAILSGAGQCGATCTKDGRWGLCAAGSAPSLVSFLHSVVVR